jgi:hypothetical protein
MSGRAAAAAPATSGERPFVHGAFARGADDEESTRFAPVGTSGAASMRAGRIPTGQPMQPMAIQQPVTQPLVGPGASGPYPPMQGAPMHAGQSGGHATMPQHMMMAQPGTAPQGFAPQMGSYPGGTAYPGGHPPMHAPMPQNGPAPDAKRDPLENALAQFKAASTPKKILIAISPLVVIASIYLLLVDDDEPRRRRGAVTTPSASVSVVVQPTAPTVPVTAPIPPTAIVTTPLTVPVPPTVVTAPTVPTAPTAPLTVPVPPTIAVTVPPPPTAPVTVVATAPAPPPIASLAPGQKTIERQAVDAMAAGDFPRAVALYTQLAQANPKNLAYAEAARILRSRLADAGPPL